MILEIAKRSQGTIKSFKRFLDDIFLLWFGSTSELHKLFKAMNELHPTIKSTIYHTNPTNEPLEDQCDCEPASSLPFLDTAISIKHGQIVVDLYKNQHIKVDTSSQVVDTHLTQPKLYLSALH